MAGDNGSPLAEARRAYRAIEWRIARELAAEFEAAGRPDIDAQTILDIWYDVEARVRKVVFERDARAQYRYFHARDGSH